MKMFFRMVERLSSWAGGCSAICILIIIALILVDILARTIVGRSTFITEEYGGYLLSWFAFLGMAYTLKADGHIRVSLLLSKLGTTQRSVLEIFAAFVGTATFMYLTSFLFLLSYDSLVTGVRSMHFSETPLFIPQFITVLGSFIMVLQLIALLGEKLKDLIQGKKEGVTQNG